MKQENLTIEEQSYRDMIAWLSVVENEVTLEVNQSYSELLFWLLLIKARALDALQKGETDV